MLVLSAEEGGFNPPGAKDFQFPPVFGESLYFTKPVFLCIFSVIVIATFFIASSRKAAVVPNRFQFAGEAVYGFVRNSIGKDVIGHDFLKYVPFLFSLFTFILVNNIFGIIPFIQFPTMSRIGFPIAITIFVFVVFHYVGMRHQGVGKYLKEIAFMPDIPKPVYLILTPIEILTYFVTRPLTLSLRLFANMFAGHLLLLVFTIGGEHLLHGDLILKIFSPFSFAFAIGLTFFELGIQCLQAYIFTLLTALYIAGALADGH
ncbi:MAG: F0F1 ATP synthase subunit A [Actinomycetota bacterium]